MKHSLIKTIFASVAFVLLLCSSLVVAGHSQNHKADKPWSAWTPKEAEKDLSRSPWGEARIWSCTTWPKPISRSWLGRGRIGMSFNPWLGHRTVVGCSPAVSAASFSGMEPTSFVSASSRKD